MFQPVLLNYSRHFCKLVRATVNLRDRWTLPLFYSIQVTRSNLYRKGISSSIILSLISDLAGRFLATH